MGALSTDLRNKLERAIIEARETAEAGAKAALEALAVHHHEPYPHQKPDQRKLRVQLRAHARQLGDMQNPKGGLAIGHLVHECAYEHWHRMLFARFLAENDLLIEPDSGMAISLGEAEELSKSAKVDLWTYASRCAEQMLPQIFRPDDPLLQVGLANEHRVKLERLLAGLAPATFKADDSLGWVYQFWQSAEKDRVNASGEKITGDTLPAVTQLFTEHYMVLFLLHNTIGAWHAGKVLATNPKLAETAASEDALRQAVALKTAGGYSFDYLRFVRGTDGKGGAWRPAAGTYERWPRTAAQLKVLDPCCGSGHFLAAGFELLIRLLMAEDGLDLAPAIDAVLANNLFGLELDARCTQIAAFYLAFASWKLTSYRSLPSLNIACTGIAPRAKKEEWLKLADAAPFRDRGPIRLGLESLFNNFVDAPTLGSLIDVSQIGTVGAADYETLAPVLNEALKIEQTDDAHADAVTAQGIVKAADILAGPEQGYTLVVTNVPYLGFRNQNQILRDFAAQYHSDGENDLATVFILRSLGLLGRNGSIAFVSPQSWMYQVRYEAFRKHLLSQRGLCMVARLGPGAFETIGGEVVTVGLSVVNARPNQAHVPVINFDVSDIRTALKKAVELKTTPSVAIDPEEYRNARGSRIVSGIDGASGVLADHASILHGQNAGDNQCFNRAFWEVASLGVTWELYQLAPEAQLDFAGRSQIVRWEQEDGMMARLAESVRHLNHKAQQWRSGKPNWGKDGVAVSLVGRIVGTLYTGDIYGVSCGVIVPKNPKNLGAIWEFVKSGEFEERLREIDPGLAISVKTVVAVPFDLDEWQQRFKASGQSAILDPESNDPTQWLFSGRPEDSTAPLQVAVARLMGYRWPAEFDDKMRLSKKARALVRRCSELMKFADDDGIVCIPSVRGEEPAADRLLALLSECGVKPNRNLDEWLRNDFFQEHCEQFNHRPFIWHIWDGRKRDGFHALVNYHKLADGKKGKKLLESLTYSYLGEWINRQKDGVKRGEDGAEDRLDAATELQKRLVAILEGEPPFDIFVRWKPLAEQPIGWEPDINDGMRMNIRPFLADDLPNGRAGAGVLRWKPNIKWDKDRGKEPDRKKSEFPWFWGWDETTVDFMGGKEFKGERFNDCHYTNAAKQKAKKTDRSAS